MIKRITIDSKVMTGQPVIAGTRLTVKFIIGLLAQGMSTKEILEAYPQITKDDILACLQFATPI